MQMIYLFTQSVTLTLSSSCNYCQMSTACTPACYDLGWQPSRVRFPSANPGRCPGPVPDTCANQYLPDPSQSYLPMKWGYLKTIHYPSNPNLLEPDVPLPLSLTRLAPPLCPTQVSRVHLKGQSSLQGQITTRADCISKPLTYLNLRMKLPDCTNVSKVCVNQGNYAIYLNNRTTIGHPDKPLILCHSRLRCCHAHHRNYEGWLRVLPPT